MSIRQNIKTGKLYEVIGVVTDATNSSCDRPMILYKDAEGNRYVREAAEFDAKFGYTREYSLYGDANAAKTKMVILARKDLNMPAGKIAAQVAHAALGAILGKGKWVSGDTFVMDCITHAEQSWMRHKFTKVALWCDDLAQMEQMNADAMKAGLNTRMIIDAGDTVFGGVPTITCLAIGPDYSELIDAITGGLKLLR